MRQLFLLYAQASSSFLPPHPRVWLYMNTEISCGRTPYGGTSGLKLLLCCVSPIEEKKKKISFRERERKRLSSLQHSWECRMTAWRQIHIDRASSSSSNLNFLTFFFFVLFIQKATNSEGGVARGRLALLRIRKRKKTFPFFSLGRVIRLASSALSIQASSHLFQQLDQDDSQSLIHNDVALSLAYQPIFSLERP